ncbi:hypothetical protein A1D23_12775 [Chelonobacter oris]|uniref:hypothetical protein n=1 Tax=Chelonobacter oris TaxID=505317 RepID=UPI00244930AB|nr:hypothetical protein [Chelonobacter oris]MDH3001388.1 hypothetical protein [Chelonobacter oris]
MNCIHYLTKIYPANQTCYLATGDFQWLQILDLLSFNNTIIINSEDNAIVGRYQNKPNNWIFDISTTIAAKTGSAPFYSFNLSNYNGLLDSSKLSTFWPNIRTKSIEKKQTVSLADYFESQQISPNWLISDHLKLQELLESNEIVLSNLDVIITRASEIRVAEQKLSLEELIGYLKTKGFKYITKETERNPELCYGIFAKDYLIKSQVLESELQKQMINIAENQTEYLQEIEGWKGKYAKLFALKNEWKLNEDKLKNELKTVKQESLELQNQLKEIKEANSLLQKESNDLDQKLAKNSDNQEKISVKIKEYIDESEKRLRDWVYRWSLNNVKQIEDFYSLQEFFKTGELFSGFYGWPISPDIGLFIINQMRQKQYDLVIEFGSGTSTLLFAKLAAAKHHQPLMSDLLPQKILSFDHHANYYQRTQVLLNTNQVAKHVDLVNAPLIEWQENGQAFLYYDCEATLQQLAQNLQGKSAKILVLVDGPPGDTCKNARYPAVPLLFKYLAEHQIDIILDDAARPEEREVAAKWQNFLSNCQIAFSDEKIINEKGIYFVKTANS